MRWVVLAGLVAAVFLPVRAICAGVYENQSLLSYFLRAPIASAVSGHATRTTASDHDASVFEVDASLPVKSNVFLQGELAYITLTGGEVIEGEFADFVFRAKMRVFQQLEPSVLLIGTLRTGSGANNVFPYSTGSSDIELGAAVVDTVTAFTWWARATGVYVTRVDDSLKGENGHDNYATAAGGIVLHLGGLFDVQGGLTTYLFRSGPTRFVYFSDVAVRYTPYTSFYGFLQGEVGDRDDRAIDFAAGLGIRVSI